MSYIKIGKNEYKLNITMKTIVDIQDSLNVNLLDPMSDNENIPLSARIAGDDIFLLKIVYQVIKNQLEKDGVAEADFYDSIGGEEMKGLSELFFKEYESFFTLRGRKGQAELLEKVRTEVENLFLLSTDSTSSSDEADSPSTNA